MSPFSLEKPCQVEQLDCILLFGVYNVCKGKTQLHRWAECLVILCVMCLVMSSVEDSHTGKNAHLASAWREGKAFLVRFLWLRKEEDIVMMGIAYKSLI